jgi:hypothetical protein
VNEHGHPGYDRPARALAPEVRYVSILTRREIKAEWYGHAVTVWQTRLDDGRWRVNGLTLDDTYYRPDKREQWPTDVPMRLILWAAGEHW